MSKDRRLAFCLRVALALLTPFALLAPSVALAGPGPIALELLPGAPEIDPAALRDAVARELDATLLDPSEAARAAVTIAVGIDRAQNDLVVERRDATGVLSRRVPLPATPAEVLRAAVFLIGNLARDEASDVLRELGPPRPVAHPAAPMPASADPPPSPPRVEQGVEPEPARFWIGVAGAYDFVSAQSSDQVCRLAQTALPVNTAGYYCVDDSGSDFPSRFDGAQNDNINPNASDRVAGGAAPGNFRAMLSFDYAATTNLLVGARLGYVANAYPGQAAKAEGKAFAPVHAELRATYVFGEAPLATAGFAPYAMVAAGVAQYSAQVPVTAVLLDPTAGPVTNAHAWELSGPAFGSVGAGVRWAPTPRLAFTFGPRLNVAFGAATLVSLSPELGVQLGL